MAVVIYVHKNVGACKAAEAETTSLITMIFRLRGREREVRNRLGAWMLEEAGAGLRDSTTSQHKSDRELANMLTCVACSQLLADGKVAGETQPANKKCLCMIQCC